MISRGTLVGLTATVLGLAGYAAGIVVAYPGRALSLALVMVGLTLLVIGDDWGVET